MRFSVTNAEKKIRLSSSWRYKFSAKVLGNDDGQEIGPDAKSSVVKIQH